MTTPNPVERSFKKAPAKVSKQVFVIAGIQCNVFGLSELSAAAERVACVWLLNPRLQAAESMEPLAHNIVGAWQTSCGSNAVPGLIAVSFDQRNHGTRQVGAKANEAWRQGNDLHAQDMFSIYHGTQLDASQLLQYLPGYIFPKGDRIIDENYALGVSLGGHCVWHCLLHEPAISTGIVVIGCPDYLALMKDRARLSKLPTYTSTSPPGISFVGSEHFPKTLLDVVDKYDPAGLLTRRTKPINQAKAIQEHLGGKRIMILSGAADKLVPYAIGKPFLDWLKNMVSPQGEASSSHVEIVDKVFPGVGHEMSPDMVEEAIQFIQESLTRHPSHSADGAKL